MYSHSQTLVGPARQLRYSTADLDQLHTITGRCCGACAPGMRGKVELILFTDSRKSFLQTVYMGMHATGFCEGIEVRQTYCWEYSQRDAQPELNQITQMRHSFI